MKTELIDKGNLLSQLTIILEPVDYKPDFKKELVKYSQKSQLKGFRKGKVPISAIRKMYGKAALVDVLNGKVSIAIQDFITKEKLEIIGSPIPSEDQKEPIFDTRVFEPYEFKFDIGMEPSFNLIGISETDEYDSYSINFEDSEVDEQIENLRKKLGEQIEVTEPIELMDIVKLKIKENDALPDEEFISEITIMPDRMTDDYKEEFLAKEIGYKSTVDIYTFEKDTSEDYVKKYFLEGAPDKTGGSFEVEVIGIKRLKPAEINEDFYKNAFGNEDIKDEATARQKIKEKLETYFKDQGESITRRYMLEELIEQNKMDLPDEFLKRWLLVTNEELSKEQVEEEYAGFRQNLKWSLIKSGIQDKYNIEIGRDEIKASIVRKLEAQFAQYGGGAMNLDGYGDKMMENEESVQKEYEELLAESVLTNVMKTVTLNEKELTVEEYQKVVEELNAKS